MTVIDRATDTTSPTGSSRGETSPVICHKSVLHGCSSPDSCLSARNRRIRRRPRGGSESLLYCDPNSLRGNRLKMGDACVSRDAVKGDRSGTPPNLVPESTSANPATVYSHSSIFVRFNISCRFPVHVPSLGKVPRGPRHGRHPRPKSTTPSRRTFPPPFPSFIIVIAKSG